MKKYFLKDGTLQQGPFDLEELKSKGINAETPVWYEGIPEWTTAGKLDELKDILVDTPPQLITPVVPPPLVEEINPVVTTTTVVTTAATVPVIEKPIAASAKPVRPATTTKKSTAWISWVLSLLVLGGVGYFIYQDIEKNKSSAGNTTQTEVTADSTATTQPLTTQRLTTEMSTADTTTTSTTSTTSTATTPDTTSTETITTTGTQPVTTTPTNTTAVTTTTPTSPTAAEQIAAKKAAAKKAEEAKKKLLALQAQKKAEEEKKKLQAAQAAQAAAAAKEMGMRNNWPKYITFGKLNYETKGDGIGAFDVPVYNSTNAMLDKVTVRIDYMKKENKIFKSETIVIYHIPPGAGLNGKAPESKKGEKVNVYITAVSSRQLHFCYPQNNGNNADPYFCN